MSKTAAVRKSTTSSVGNAGEARRARRQRPSRPSFNQLEVLHPGTSVLTEGPEHRAGDGKRVLFFHPPHRHAQVSPFADHGNAKRIELLANSLGYLVRHPLLHLKAAGKNVDQSGNLAEPDHMALRN